MKQEISTLMDGELFEDDAESLFERVKRNPEAHEDWAVYHLIGDVLRQPEHIHGDISARVRERMQDEPVVLVPRIRAARQRAGAIALSAAASLAAIGLVGWMAMQISPDTEPPVQMAAQVDALRPASLHIQSRSGNYLMAHQEYSPSTDMNGGASYIRTASFSSEEK